MKRTACCDVAFASPLSHEEIQRYSCCRCSQCCDGDEDWWGFDERTVTEMKVVKEQDRSGEASTVLVLLRRKETCW